MSDACREQCDRSGEPLAGSAGAARTSVAIAWPKRLWHADKAARSEGLPARLAELEGEAKRSDAGLSLRVFQRAPGMDTSTIEVLCWRGDAPSFRAPAVPVAELAPLVERALAGAAPHVAHEPLGAELLVCTDGRHDDCCARFGRPVYRALCDEAARRANAPAVSESSHLGGHRFAANVLVLPEGDLYGRLEPRDSGPLLDALERGALLRYRYRGRLGASEACAAADALLAARLPDGARWELAAEEPAGSGGACLVRATVREAEQSREVRVRCERQHFSGPASCGAEAEQRERWVGVALEERAASERGNGGHSPPARPGRA